MPQPPSVHIAILRKVRPGQHEAFERALQDFFGVAAREPGVDGAHLIRPLPGRDDREYGILRSFASDADMRHFYASDLYRRWQDTVAPLVEGEPRKRELHGLEAFFREDQTPPAWKMALLTWVGVNPAVYLFSALVSRLFGELPMLWGLLLVNVFVVASLTWCFMPLLTRLFRRWLLGPAARSHTPSADPPMPDASRR